MPQIWGSARPQTLTGILEARATAHPERVAVTISGEDITYAELVSRSDGYARGLLQLGVSHGDVVAIFAENSPTHVLAQFGAARIGAIEVMLNTALKGTFLTHQLRDSTAKVLIVEPRLLDTALDVLGEVPTVRAIVVTGPVSSPPHRAASVPVLPLDVLSDNEQTSPNTSFVPSWTDPCSIVYTSGTTGLSKGALISHNYLTLFAELESALWYRDEGDAFYSVGPLYHIAAKGIGVLGAIYRGARCVQDERLSVSNFWKRVQEENCTSTLMLGSVAMLLWGREPSEDERIRTVIGIPIPPNLHHAMAERWQCTFESAYGLSEACPVVHTGASPMRPGSAGKADTEHFDVRIFDQDDNELPAGEVGEVVVRGRRPHTMFEGYWGNSEATQKVMRNQWFHTGDLGRFDEDGYFYFVDRAKDYLRRRGENISSYEVESAIATHPDVLEAAVIAVPSDLGEDEVQAVVVLRPGSSLTYEALSAHCIERIPYFAVPRYFQLVGDLPRTPSGKVMKNQLRTQGEQQVWDREVDGGISLSSRSRESLRTGPPRPGAPQETSAP